MSNQYINFYYDPSRQGYDTEAWSLLDGVAPVVNGGYMFFSNNTIRHYGDILRGDFVFGMNFASAPKAGVSRIWGLNQANKGNCLTFNISGTTFSANSSDGNGNTNSVVIPWLNSWTLTDTEFRIRWEAGIAHFYIGGGLQTVISDASITGEPMSLYIADQSFDGMNMKYIEAKAIQSYFQNTPLVGSQTFGRLVMTYDQLTTSDVVTNLVITPLVQNLIVDPLTVTENITVFYKILDAATILETLAVTESISTGYGPGMFPAKPAIETLTVSEALGIFESANQLKDQLGISELVTVSTPA